jgi:hypothetical protein
MRTLHLFLERGFSGEGAAVRVEGEEIFHSEAVETDLMMGFAAQVDVPLTTESGKMEVCISSDGLAEAVVPLPAGTKDLWVRVWMEGGRLRHALGTEPLGFL